MNATQEVTEHASTTPHIDIISSVSQLTITARITKQGKKQRFIFKLQLDRPSLNIFITYDY